MIAMVDCNGDQWVVSQTYNDGSFRAYRKGFKHTERGFTPNGWCVASDALPFQLKPLTEEGSKCEPIKVEMINDRFQVTVAPTSDPEDMVDAALALLTMAALNKRKG